MSRDIKLPNSQFDPTTEVRNLKSMRKLKDIYKPYECVDGDSNDYSNEYEIGLRDEVQSVIRAFGEYIKLDDNEIVCEEIECPVCSGRTHTKSNIGGIAYKIPCSRCDATGKILKKVFDPSPKLCYTINDQE